MITDVIYTDDVCGWYERRSSRGASKEKLAGHGRQRLGCSLCGHLPCERSCKVDHGSDFTCGRWFDSSSWHRYAQERECQRVSVLRGRRKVRQKQQISRNVGGSQCLFKLYLIASRSSVGYNVILSLCGCTRFGAGAI